MHILLITLMSFIPFIGVVEMKRLTHEKMREVEELMAKKEHPYSEENRAAIAKGQANLEKYKKLVVMTQSVLRVNETDRHK